MKCDRCGYEWPNRTDDPKECPRCKGRLGNPRKSFSVRADYDSTEHKRGVPGPPPKYIARRFVLSELSKASVKQVLIISLLVMLLTPLLLIFRDGTVLASPNGENTYTYVATYDNVKGTVENFDNQKQVDDGYSILREGATVVWDNYPAVLEPYLLIDNSTQKGDSLSSISDAQTLDNIYENIVEENNEEQGSPYLAIVQGADEKDANAWYGWVVVNPSDESVEVTEVRFKDEAGTDLVWVIDTEGYPASNWNDGGTEGLYWSGSEYIPAHSALHFRVLANSSLGDDYIPDTMIWSAIVDGENLEVATSTVVGSNDTWHGGMFYNQPSDTTEQASGEHADGQYALILTDENGDNILAGTEYTFYVNISEWSAGKGFSTIGDVLTIIVPKEFTGVEAVDESEFTAVISGGGVENWTITASALNSINVEVNHFSFKATTPTGYSTNKNWEFDTRFIGTDGKKGEPINLINEAIVLVQADEPFDYNINWEHHIEDVPSDGDNYKVTIYGYADENVGSYIWNSSTSGWENMENLPTTEGSSITYLIDNIENYLVGGDVCIKYEDNDNTDTVQSTVHIDLSATQVWKETPSSTYVTTEPLLLIDNSTRLGENLSLFSDAQTLDGVFENIVEENNEEKGEPYFLMGQGGYEKGTDAWVGWIVVNPTGAPITVTEVRFKDNDAVDWNWTITAGANYPVDTWTDGGTAGIYWSGSEEIPAHSATYFKVKADGQANVKSDEVQIWTVDVGETLQRSSVSYIAPDKGAGGGIFYNRPSDTTKQSGMPADGNYTLIDTDENDDNITGGKEYTFYLNLHEWANQTTINAGGDLVITIPKEFTDVAIVDNTDFTDAVVSGGGEENWTIQGTNDSAISDVSHFGFKATTPLGYGSRTNWEIDTRFTGVDGKGYNVHYICEADVLVQPDASFSYDLNWEHRINIPNRLSNKVRIYGYSDSEENFSIYTWDGENWQDSGYNLPTSVGWVEYNLNENNIQNRTVSIKYDDDNTGDDNAENIYIDYCGVESSSATYSMEIYENIENITTGENYFLEVRYKLDNANDNFRVQVWNGSTWEYRGENLDNSTDWENWSYQLLPSELTGTGDDVSVRFVDVDSGSTGQNAILKDYLRVRGVGLVAPEWNLIEGWTGTVNAPVTWTLVESWEGTVQAPVEWQLIETWTGTVEAPVVWQLLETWTGAIEAPAVWQLIETWTGTVSAPAQWQLIETWTGTIEAPVEWQLIETWDGTVQAPVEWQLIETWTGTIEAPAEWRLIETWTGTVEAPTEWQLIETWDGTINAPAAWYLIESWDGTIQAPAAWQLIESWDGDIEAPAEWNLVESWSGTVGAPAIWQLVESWVGTVEAPANWVLIETWDGTITAPAEWQGIESWGGTISVPAEWQIIESWSGTVSAPIQWQLIETWTGTVEAPEEFVWNLIETWTGTVNAPAVWGLIESWAATINALAEWHLVEEWAGKVEAPANWQLIETWIGTVEVPAIWQMIETWTGTVSAPAEWQLIETWTGAIEAPVGWQLIETWEGTVEAPANWNLAETWTGRIKTQAFAEWQLIETWTGTIEAPTEWRLIETWTGTIEAPTEWQLIETWSGTVKSPSPWQLIETWTGTVKTPPAEEPPEPPDTTPPPVPSLISPSNNSILPDNTPTFDWSDVTDPSGVTYTFEILGVLTKSSLVSSACTLADDEALSDGDYYWRVRAVDGASNESSWSSVWWFVIKAAAEVTTDPATSITTSSAVLNATIWYGVYGSVDIRFEYRIVGGAWTDTPWDEGYTGAEYSKEVSGLYASTIHEFKAHIKYDGLEGYGDIRTFKTKTVYVPPPWDEEPPPSPVVYDVRLDAYPERVPRCKAVTLRIDVYRVQGQGTVDVTVSYKITDEAGNVYVQKKFTEAIYAKIYELPFYTFWPLGVYTADVGISWPGGTAEAADTFEVVEVSIIERLNPVPIILIGGIVAVVIVMVILIYLRKKRFS